MPHTKRKFPHNRVANAERRSGMLEIQRRYPIGAELIDEGRTHFFDQKSGRAIDVRL